MQDVIKSIEKACSVYFIDNKISLNKAGYNLYVMSGEVISLAINNNKNDKTLINVLNWFKDFWIYIELRFIEDKPSFPQSFISLSIFQGEASDEVKTQLFRAEWDNHKNNFTHPQPHWHIYPFKYSAKRYEDFETYNELLEEEEDSFSKELAATAKDEIVDIRDFHFAMDGRWASSGPFIHRITDGKMIASWLSGLLDSVRIQLDHISR